jgi:hypothetical protein
MDPIPGVGQHNEKILEELRSGGFARTEALAK